MPKYLGETPVKNMEGTPFEGFGPKEWALYYMDRYGQIDGAHHKQWVLDQVARILHGTKVVVSLAKWDDGTQEYRVDTVIKPTSAYTKWVKAHCKDGYNYDEGIAP